MDLTEVFDTSNMDKDVLQRIHECVANIEIVRALQQQAPFMDLLSSIAKNGGISQERRILARKIIERMDGVLIFEDAISNTQGDYAKSARTLSEICTSEYSFGIWLQSMITNEDLLDRLAEYPPLAIPLQSVPLFFTSNKSG